MSRATLAERIPKKRAVLEKDKLSKKALILNAAASLLSKKDWSELSMDEVAKKAKIAKGTLYLYFPTKEDLCLQVHIGDYESWFLDLESFLVNDPNTSDEAFCKWFVGSMSRHPRFLKLLPIVPTILEKNASVDTIREFKTNLRDRLFQLLPILKESMRFESAEKAFFFLMQCHALAIGSWSHGFPATNVKQALVGTELSIFLLDYETFLSDSVITLLKGHRNLT